MAKFWIVMRKCGAEGPKVNTGQGNNRFTSRDAAKAEASRLAGEHKAAFMVMGLEGVATPTTPPVEWEDAAERAAGDDLGGDEAW